MGAAESVTWHFIAASHLDKQLSVEQRGEVLQLSHHRCHICGSRPLLAEPLCMEDSTLFAQRAEVKTSRFIVIELITDWID